ncbi:MAG: 4Fe-4S binding protein [Candidatus Omnitrophica bacterium]|nr:4Fe-4S binding protein [Candidatus Omnitrophota bacterium]
MKRKIVRIDTDKCNGCGVCIPACHEGAIKIVNGKARLSEDALCDGLGACLGECPQGAIAIEEREADEYSEIAALENIMKEGPEALDAHLKHLKDHGEVAYLAEATAYLQKKGSSMGEKHQGDNPTACGCPGSMTQDFRKKASASDQGDKAVGPVSSALEQWPIQLRLLNPHAPFFQDADLVVSADCVAFTFGDFHRKFLKGKALALFCPKLDLDLEEYVEKLSTILRDNNIRSVTALRMEVPCCGGTVSIVEEALKRSGKNIIMKEYTISLRGEII